MPVLAGFGIVVLTFLLLIPAVQNIVVKQQLITQKKTELAELIKKKNFLTSFDTTLLPSLKEADAALPQEKDAASILISLENISTRVGVAVQSVSLEPGLVSTESATASGSAQPVAATGVTKNGAPYLAAFVRAVGSNEQTKNFITQILSSRRLLDIDTLSLTFPQGQDFVDTTMTVHSYYLPPITSIGTATDLLPELTPAEKAALTQINSYPVMSIYLVGDQQVDIGSQPVGKTNLFLP